MTTLTNVPKYGAQADWRMRHSLAALVITALAPLSVIRGQTMQPTQAIHVTECQSFLGIQSCSTLQTNRISKSFAVSNAGES